MSADVVVVGAGIAGLTVAHELATTGADVRVLEAGHRVGGRMATTRHAGFVIDEGAEQISARGYRATWELLRRTGFTPAEVPEIGHAIGVWRDGRAHPGVADPRAVVTGAGLSRRARLDLARFQLGLARGRAAFDPDQPERTPLGTATVAEMAARYHPDLHDHLLAPVASAFFGWDTRRSCAAPMVALMNEVGSVSCWRTYRDGMDSLARRLAGGVPVETGCAVREVARDGHRARIVTDRGDLSAASVVLCVPAPVAAPLYPTAPEPERAFLRACTFAPVLKVACLLDRPLAPRSPVPLYALLAAAGEDALLAGLVVDHAKHPGRVPAGRGLISLIAAPAAVPGLLSEPDAAVAGRLVAAAERYLPGITAATTTTLVHRFRHGLPEAPPAALRLRAAFADRPVGPVDYAGDWVLLRPSSEGAVRAAALASARVRSLLARNRREARV
ncbi:protoporphyrinogen/coproporphyrinogen oxidase [Amycolatopsis thermalba]|uniref:protoporphyrinogen/coproporphyrinogen oxidase n=1 Tax=Amycolatopsis thermalba TaxID=944492 RepID=UPI000E2686B1|nr:FAD-dependent oxidoreductase [Amycolatopsis thermalba]